MGRKYISFFVFVGVAAHAMTVGEISFPDEVKAGGTRLVVNGAGVRTATIFKAKVYAAALYLKAKSPKEAVIFADRSPKVLKMIFLREIGAEDIGRAWDQSFADNCDPDECARYAQEIAKLKTLMPSVKEGDEMVYEFSEGKARVFFKGQLSGEISGQPFAMRLLSTWIGKAPPTDALKRALLSQP